MDSITKTMLRRKVRAMKSTYSAAQLAYMSQQVADRLVATDIWQQSCNVLLYASLPDEVCTDWLIQQAIGMNKQVFLPVVVGDNLELHHYDNNTLLYNGAYNISEPMGQRLDNLSIIDLAIVPGMAFTADGCRLGRGKGYYDRLLPQLTKAQRLGICFPFQLLPYIPTEQHDIRMNSVVTIKEAQSH